MFIPKNLVEFIRMISLMGRRKFIYSISIIISCVCFVGYQILFSFTIKNLINSVVSNDYILLINAFSLIFLAMLCACIIDPIVTYLYKYCIKKTISDIRLMIFRKIKSISYSYFDFKHNGEIISLLNNDLNVMENAYGNQLYRFMLSIFYGIGSIISMFSLNINLTIITIIVLSISSIINIKFSKKFKIFSEKVQSRTSDLTKIILDIISQSRILKMLNLNTYFMSKFMNKNTKLYEAKIEKIKFNAIVESINFLFGNLNQMSTFCIGALWKLQGKIDFGTILAVILLQNAITAMFVNTGSYYSNLQTSLAGASRVFNFIDYYEDDYCQTNNACNLNNHSNNEIYLKNISFGYKSDEMLLKNITLQIKNGESIGIVGKSGSGKSTIFKLLLKLYKINSGEIYINGKSISFYTYKDIGCLITYIPQESYLFNCTILENIKYGKIDATYDEIIGAAKKAYAHEFIKELPNGYNTIIKENGSNLSLGQKQRISIARAILKDSPIVLLDEVTSALDLKNEELIINALKNMTKNKISITIAHRLENIKNVDRIITIENGKIVNEINISI